MTDPRRWRGSFDPADDEMASLFASGRPTRAMSSDARARFAGRAAKSTATLSWTLGWKAAGAAAIGLAAIGGFIAANRVATDAPLSMREASARAFVVTPVALAERTTPSIKVDELPSATIVDPAPRPSASVTRAVDTLAAELELLDHARAVFSADPSAALTILDDHAHRYPAGKLAIERELLALDALARLGRTSAEHDRADRLAKSVRGTIYEERVRAHLGP